MLKRLRHYIWPKTSIIAAVVCVFPIAGLLSYASSIILDKLFGAKLLEDIYWTAVVGIAGYIITAYYRRQIKRYNIFCHLEVELNFSHGALNDMILTLKGMINNGFPIIFQTDELNIDFDLVKEVGRLDIKNHLIDIVCDFRKINHDWKIASHFGEENRPLIMGLTGSPQEQNLIKKHGLDILGGILKKAEITQNLMQQCMAEIRVYMKTDKPAFATWFQPYLNDRNFKELARKDREQLEKEMAESQ